MSSRRHPSDYVALIRYQHRELHPNGEARRYAASLLAEAGGNRWHAAYIAAHRPDAAYRARLITRARRFIDEAREHRIAEFAPLP